ncbi:MAG: type I polyketide synthase, partial [Myxococcota bacterium]
MSAIAIVGMGARFAGAEDLSAYWTMIRTAQHAFGPVPEDRWPADLFYSTNRRATDKTYAPHGAFIKDIRSFPALALGLPPRRVEVMDPQQRLALEVCINAVEDAGYASADLPRRTGVFMGVTAQEYRTQNSVRVAAMMMAVGAYGRAPKDPTVIAEAVENIVPSRPYAAPGGLGNMCAATVAQELDLHGPAYTTDAACASAHMAIYDAVQQLRSGAIDAALAGGTYVQITADHYVVFSRIGAMSAEGYCRPFDHRADGFVQGDGAGVLLLKRLDDAIRDGDRIYATIEGAAINNDGRGDGPMAPRQEGQTEAINMAWQDAGIDKSTLGYMEAHGTGTAVGDPAEVDGLTQAVGPHVNSVALGSAKANVGHTMSAAGAAGMIRAALAIHHSMIPPMCGFEAPNPKLNLEDLPFWIPTEATPWTGSERVAACSAFGFGGTNGHIVLRSWTGPTGKPTPAPAPAIAQPELVLMSAPTTAALKDLAARTADAVETDPRTTVAGVARAWAKRRRQAARLGVVATTADELVSQLRAFANGDLPRGVKSGECDPNQTPNVAFMYPGQGAQRVGMLRDAQQRFPAIRAQLDELEHSLNGALPVPLTQLLYPETRTIAVDDDTAAAQLTDTANCQPAMLSVGLALTALLDQVGIRPTVVVGHSLGEFTAASAGGVMSATDAARFVAARGQAMAKLDGDHGTMAAVMAERAQVEPLLVDGAVLANINHPRQLVVSGTTEAIAQVVRNAKAADIKAVPLQVSHGFHSPTLAGLDSEPLLNG